MRESSPPVRVVVLGGGVTGLLTARRLAQQGLAVTLVEAEDRLGGQVRTVEVGGRAVDVGAEALHLGAPAARTLVTELGLADTVVGARQGTTWVWTSRGLRPLPAGVTPTGPTRLRPVVTSGVMSLPGLARAGLEPLAARVGPGLPAGEDVSVGHFVTSRFGHEVTDRFIDPLLGTLHAGDVRRLSLRACAPGLVEAATQRRSLLRRRAARLGAGSRARNRGSNPLRGPMSGPRGTEVDTGGPSLPAFASWPEGLRTMTERMLADVPVSVRLGVRATALMRVGHGYRITVQIGAGGTETATIDADVVVLALPPQAAAALLATSCPSAAEVLADSEVARVATCVLEVDRADTAGLRAFAGTGVLLPSTSGTLLKAITNLSRKWAHLADDDVALIRLSAGRAGSDALDELDDTQLAERLLQDLRDVTGFAGTPRRVHVQRWTEGLPQLSVGHHARLEAVRAQLAAALPGVHVAGAAYDGVGLGSCIASAEATAEAVLQGTHHHAVAG